MKRIILTTGGTGGHIFPAIAVAEELRVQYPRCEIMFVGGTKGQEADLVVRANIDFVSLPVSGFIGKGIKKIGTIWGLLRSYVKAKYILKKFQPHMIIGFGGYASFPMVLAASKNNYPTAIHEQNATMGLSNKMLGHHATKVFLSFPCNESDFPQEKCLVSGNPVRLAIRELAERLQNTATKEQAIPTKRLFIMGGSLGAAAINEHIISILPTLINAGIEIWHQTGKTEYEKVRQAYTAGGAPDARVEAFIDNMPQVYEWADLIVCRAGASTIAELTVLGKPAIFIPFPFAAHNHQVINAQALEKIGAALLIEQKNLVAAKLEETIIRLINDKPALQTMSQAARTLAIPNAAQFIAAEIKDIMKNGN